MKLAITNIINNIHHRFRRLARSKGKKTTTQYQAKVPYGSNYQSSILMQNMRNWQANMHGAKQGEGKQDTPKPLHDWKQ